MLSHCPGNTVPLGLLDSGICSNPTTMRPWGILGKGGVSEDLCVQIGEHRVLGVGVKKGSLVLAKFWNKKRMVNTKDMMLNCLSIVPNDSSLCLLT